jgi:hypothetical protein
MDDDDFGLSLGPLFRTSSKPAKETKEKDEELFNLVPTNGFATSTVSNKRKLSPPHLRDEKKAKVVEVPSNRRVRKVDIVCFN